MNCPSKSHATDGKIAPPPNFNNDRVSGQSFDALTSSQRHPPTSRSFDGWDAKPIPDASPQTRSPSTPGGLNERPPIMTESDWWWVLLAFEAIGVTGQWIVGSGRWWGWLIVLGHSIPWVIVAVTFDRWGAAAMAPLWWTVNSVNAYRWHRHPFKR